METKAVCIEPNYPGTRLYEVGDLADLSEIDYKTRHCWEIGNVNLKDITELDDERFYLSKEDNADKIKRVNKKIKEEVRKVETERDTYREENAELKLKLAKLEAKSAQKEDSSKNVEDMIPKPKSKKEDEKPEGDGDIF